MPCTFGIGEFKIEKKNATFTVIHAFGQWRHYSTTSAQDESMQLVAPIKPATKEKKITQQQQQQQQQQHFKYASDDMRAVPHYMGQSSPLHTYFTLGQSIAPHPMQPPMWT
jgi:hypothetical protein